MHHVYDGLLKVKPELHNTAVYISDGMLWFSYSDIDHLYINIPNLDIPTALT